MLTDEVEQYLLESQQLEKELANDNTSSLEQQISTSLYEDMVKMAYKDPDRIASIRQIVEKADETVIPDISWRCITHLKTFLNKSNAYEPGSKRFPACHRKSYPAYL